MGGWGRASPLFSPPRNCPWDLEGPGLSPMHLKSTTLEKKGWSWGLLSSPCANLLLSFLTLFHVPALFPPVEGTFYYFKFYRNLILVTRHSPDTNSSLQENQKCLCLTNVFITNL